MRHSSLRGFVIIIGITIACWPVSAQPGWVPQTSGTTTHLRGVSFANSNAGFACGSDGAVLRTTNGGERWEQLDLGQTEWLSDISYVDDTTCVIVGGHGIILRTADGGDSWTDQSVTTFAEFNAVSFFDADHGVLVGAQGTIMWTDDGGAHWTKAPFWLDSWISDVTYRDTNTVTIVGSDRLIARSTDGGATWMEQTAPTGSYLRAVDFADGQYGLIAGYDGNNDGIILRTTNGGSTWEQRYATAVGFLDISVLNREVAIAVGLDGTIVRTDDGGTSWYAQYSGTTVALAGVSLTHPDTGTIIGDYGTILRCVIASPSNDECSSATFIETLPFSATQDTRRATANPADPPLPCADGGGGRTVWYRFRPSTTTWARISTVGSTPADYDIAIGLFTGACNTPTLVACNDDAFSGLRQAELTYLLQGEQIYTLLIAEWNGGGPMGGVPTGGDLLLTIEAFEDRPLARGPRRDSIAGGVTVSTDPYSATAPSGPGIGVNLPSGDGNIADAPVPGLLKAATGPEGSNYFEEAAMPAEVVTSSAPVVVNSFAGIPDNNRFIPPAQDVAAGPTHVVEVVNCQFRIFEKTGKVLKTIHSYQWFESLVPEAGITNPPQEPQIVYDHFGSRFVMSWTFFTDSTAWILLSVSDDENPLGTWYNWALPTNQAGELPSLRVFDDFPQLGFDQDALYISSNCRALDKSSFRHSRVKIIEKAQLYQNSAGPVRWVDFWDLRDPDNPDVKVSNVQPTVSLQSSGSSFLVGESPYTTKTYITLWTLTTPHSTPLLTAENLPVVAYSSPPNADQLGGSTTPIEAGASRFRSQAIYRDSSLWAVHSVASGTDNRYSAIRYLRLNPFSASILEDIAMGAEGFWHYYPALMVDPDTNLVITFSRSGETEYVGGFLTGRKPADPPGLAPSVALKSGEANYVKTYGGSRNRWGPHMGIALDPLDPHAIWAVAQYAASPINRWGTWIGEVEMGPLTGPLLKIDSTAVQFARAEVGTAGDTLECMIRNLGGTALELSSVTLQHGSNFTLVDPPLYPVTLLPGDSATLQVAFLPIESGELSDTIALASSDPWSPVRWIGVSGRAVAIAQAIAGVMYGTTTSPSSRLVVLDPQTGIGSVIGSVQVEGVEGLALHPLRHELYSVATNDSASTLYRLSSEDGDYLASATLPVGSVQAIAFTSPDTLYAGTSTGQLFRIGTAHWTTELLGTNPGMAYSSLAFNPRSRTLWASNRFPADTTRGAIYRVDPATGTVAYVGQTGMGSELQHLAIDASGSIYGIASSSQTMSWLYRIDTLTASATLLGVTGIVGINTLAMRTDTLLVSTDGVRSLPIPETYGLSPNYPNPFNPTTTLEYALPRSGFVTLKVFSLLGEEVATLVAREHPAGVYTATWDASAMPSGVYFYRLSAGQFVETKKMLLMR